jgi:hypothetical protein
MFSPLGSTRNLIVAFALALSVLLVSFAGWRVNAGRPPKPADKTRQANAKAGHPYIEYVLSVQGEPREENSLAAPAAQRPAKVSPAPKESKLTRAAAFNGDLRNLPQSGPRKKERPERHGPKIELRTIGAGGLRDTGSSLNVPNAPAPSPLTNFNGLDFLNFGAGRPPDTNGDVGPTYFIQSVNTSMGIYRKSDNVRVAALSLDTFMSQGNFGNLCDTDNFGDPVVLYDSFEDRWVITDFAFQLDGSNNVVFPPGMFQCFAVSKTSDPVSGGWNFYSINTTGGLGDYGKFGIWPDGIYMTVNMFDYAASGSFQNVRVYAFNKAQMYANATAPQVVSFDLPPDEFTVLPANARLQTGTPPPGTPNLYSVVWQFANVISTYKFHVDWNSISLSTFTGPFDTLAPTSFAVGPETVPAMGGLNNDTLSHRLMMQNQYTNIGGVESLWNSHTVQGSSVIQAAVRYYQVNVTGGTIAANTTQAATHNPDTTNRYMPSLALNRLGDMMIGYNASSTTLKPAIRYAGRLAADPVNTLPQTETSLIEGGGAQTFTNRWGDYSTMTLDPDGCTFWFTSEYYAVNGTDWQTRIGSFKFPGCTNVTSGTVMGTVSASVGGAPISGATVALGSRTVTTNASGVYTFTGIAAGTYPSLSASAPGFNASTVASLVVTSSATTTQNFALGTAPNSGCLADTTQADFQMGVPTNVDLTSTPGSVILSNAANLDQSYTGGTGTGTSFTATSWNGQTFIPASTGTLVKADVQLFCANGVNSCTGTTPNITVSIRNTSGGLPTGADLATATIPGFSSGAGVFYTATFGAPAMLTAGTQYALILRPVSNPSVGNYFWIRAQPGTYANGQRVLSTDSGSIWTTDSTRDYNFRTYMQTGFAASGNLISGTKDANPAVTASAAWTTLSWTATTPANTALQFQVAGSNNVYGPFNFVGPDGTAATFFTTSGTALSQFNGLRYLKYKAYLSTTNSAVTPTLNDVTVCFNNAVNNLPTITAGGTFARQQGSPSGAAVQIATVSDIETPAGSLTVTATTLPTGIAVMGITNTSGMITANVAALCNAALGNNVVTLTVTDGSGAMATANFTVNVSSNTAPVLGYGTPQAVQAGGALTVNPSSGPSDNGSVASIVLLSQGTYTGTISVNNATGVVSISNAAPVGSHTIAVRATDNCGVMTDGMFTLNVNNNLPQITAAAPLARTRASAGTVSTIATVSDTETAAGSLTVAATTVPTGITVTGITNTNGTITANVAALCNAALGANTIVLTVTDGNSGMATANLTVNVAANTPPVLTYNNQAVAAGGTLNINPATGPSDNGTVSTVVVQSQGTYTGTISVNASGVVAISNAKLGGVHTITIRATDDCGATTDALFTLTVNCQTITLNPATLPNGTVGAGYNQTITASGGTGPYTFTTTVGALPTGLSLAAGGGLSGTPSVANAFNFTVQATDANGCTGTLVYAVTINLANNLPTINAVAVNRQQGSPAANVTIANVNDLDQALNTLGVTVNGLASATVNGVTVSGLSVSAAGVVTANVVASCTATAANFTLTVADAVLATAQATLTVTVTANAAPVLTYSNQALLAGAALNINPTSGPSDNGSISTIALLSQGTYTGTISVNNATGVVSISNATPVGVHTITIRVTDNCSTTTDASFTLTVNNNLPQITAAAPLARTQGSAGTATTIATVSDIETPRASLVVTVMSVPTGINVTGISAPNATTGEVTATVAADCSAATGANTVVLKVTDGNSGTATANLTVNVTANSTPVLTYTNQSVAASGALNINPATGPSDNGTVNSIVLHHQGTYTGTINVNNGTGVVSISNATPVGTHSITIRATDNCGATTDAVFTIAVGNNPPTITAGGTFARQQGSPAGAAVQIATVNDTETSAGSLTVTATTVPTGISISAITNTNGTINATIAAGCGAALGNNVVTLTVTDANNATATANLTVNVTANNPPTLTYTNQSVAAGGALNVNPTTGPGDNGSVSTIVVQSQGTYTGNILVNNGTGVVALSNAKPGGVHTLTIRITDNCGALTDATFTLTVNCPTINLSPATLPNGTAGTSYNQTITASGGTAPYSFTISTGTPPPGVTLAAGGALTGTPTGFGTFNFTVMATDANGCTGTLAHTLLINPACGTITVNPATLPNGFVATVYNQSLSATGGTAPYTFAVTAGSLPTGLNLASSGTLTGTPTTANMFNFTMTATDNNGCTGTRAYTVIVSGNGLQFFPLPQPVRLLETRAAFSGCTNPGTPINANGTLTLPARTVCAGIPANAAAVTGNITVVPAGPGFLTLFPSSATQPVVANSNFVAGEITNNVFTVGLGAGDGAFKIFSSATTDVIVDVTGYYAPPGTGGLYFHPLLTPVRLLETRLSLSGCITPGTPLVGTGNPNADPNLDLLLQGRSPITAPCNAIPATAQVLVGNATSVFPSSGGYLTIYPSGGTRPTVASSNYAGADIINGPFAVKLGADGKFKVYTLSTTHLVIDILGYYSSEATDANGAGLLFNPLPSPVRLLETRPDFPGFPLTGCTRPNAPITGNLALATHTQMAANFCGLPAAAQAVVGNVSVVNTAGAGFLTLFPANLGTAPLVATSNYPTPATFGYNRHYIVGLSPGDGKFKVLTQFTTDLILDASGYFAP